MYGEIVPVLLSRPSEGEGPWPVVVAVHGLGSNKAQVTAQVAPALTKKGFAVLAPDMPMHGERPGDPWKMFDMRDLPKTGRNFHQAVTDVRQTMDLAEGREDLNLKGGVFLVGYSMGSWIDSVTGPADDRVRGMVLMVGGATDTGGLSLLMPQLATIDPVLAIPHFIGRPLLMLNADNDRTVTPEMSKRLYGAAADPKEQRWYKSGHLLPTGAYEDAAAWIAAKAKEKK